MCVCGGGGGGGAGFEGRMAGVLVCSAIMFLAISQTSVANWLDTLLIRVTYSERLVYLVLASRYASIPGMSTELKGHSQGEVSYNS